MIIELSTELFVGMTDDERLRFWQLMYAIVESPVVHALLLEPVEEAGSEPVALTDFLSRESCYHQSVVRGLLETGPVAAATSASANASDSPGYWCRGGKLRVAVQRRGDSDWRSLKLTLSDALALVQEPLHLLLENGRNDFGFLRFLCQPSERRTLSLLEDAPARLFERGGGMGEIEARLRPLAEKDKLDGVEYRRLWKTWVMFDKDAAPSDARQASSAVIRLVQLCERIRTKHGVPLSWVCLQRREIESYIPDEGLPDGVREGGARQWLTQARKTTGQDVLAWAYDMKGGLLGDLKEAVGKERRERLKSVRDEFPTPDEIKMPFSSLDDPTRRKLARGFGKNVLNSHLSSTTPPGWLESLRDEYDRGPSHQLPRQALIQSIFDRI